MGAWVVVLVVGGWVVVVVVGASVVVVVVARVVVVVGASVVVVVGTARVKESISTCNDFSSVIPVRISANCHLFFLTAEKPRESLGYYVTNLNRNSIN